jgi:hypothetical protein
VQWEQLIKLALDARLTDLHVALPGKVELWDNDSLKVSVRPMIKRAIETVSGGSKVEELPVIQNVRVVYPGGGGFAVAYPLSVGDTGVLLFCERNIAEWGRTGENSNPRDRRLHGLAGAVFLPGLRTDGDAITVATDGLTLGAADGSFAIKIKSDVAEIGGSSDAAALASKTNEQINDLKTAISGWSPVANDGGAALKVALATWFGVSASVGSSKLKLGG